MKKKSKKRRHIRRMVRLFAGLILILGLIMAVSNITSNRKEKLLSNKDKFYKGIYVEKISLEGMKIGEAKKAVLSKMESDCPWSMKATFKNKTFEVEDLISDDLDAILKEAILIGHSGGDAQRLKEITNLKRNPKHYTVESQYDGTDFAAVVEKASDKLTISPLNADITGYNEANGEFIYSKAQVGYEVDKQDLICRIKTALKEKKYNAVIEAKMNEISPEIDDMAIKEKVGLMSEFTTTATYNGDRNANIALAISKINGLILKPGEEFSMNQTTGPRTIEKGYKAAGVIRNGKLAEEPGGGVCQVSTTIYNAVVKAGLETKERFSHSLEPHYITPGEDAMVSYPNADFKFVNNAPSSILVKITFQNRVLKARIYGVPILEEGVTLQMASEVASVIPMPAPQYQEDSSLHFNQKVVMNGKDGKKVMTYLVKKKNGVEVSREFLHSSTYKAKATVIKRNSKAKPENESEEPSAEPSDDLDQTTAPNNANMVTTSPSVTVTAVPEQATVKPSSAPTPTEKPVLTKEPVPTKEQKPVPTKEQKPVPSPQKTVE